MTPARPSEWLRLLAGVEPAVLEPGSTGHLIVEAVLPAGGHIEAHEPPEPFLIPTVLELSGIDGISYGPVSYPEPFELELSWSPVRLKVLTGRVRFAVPLEAHISALPGPRNISAALQYQACIDGVCLPPKIQETTAYMSIAESRVRTSAAGRAHSFPSAYGTAPSTGR